MEYKLGKANVVDEKLSSKVELVATSHRNIQDSIKDGT